MLLTGESSFISAKSGTKKDGSEWYMAKFHDEDAESYFAVFVDKDMFNKLTTLPKKAPVMLTISMVPGNKYFELESLEIIKN